jgi:hypothetical protein
MAAQEVPTQTQSNHPRFEAQPLYDGYHLPTYTTQVNDEAIRALGPLQDEEFGQTQLERWQMNDTDQTQYNILRCEAYQPKTDIWVVKDTAWGTQPAGLNVDVARKLMKLGFNVLIKGPEIGSSLPLSESAHNTHAILDAMSRLGHLNAAEVALEGYSRGSMIGFGTNAYAASFDRKVLYSNLTDPCVAVPVGFNLETVKKGATLGADIAMLNLAIGRALLNRKRTKDVLETIDPTKEGLQQFVRTGKPLMNGEAGKMAARTPLDMQATIAFFRQCRVNDVATYRRILADRPGVRFVQPEGGHGAGIDEKIIGNIAVRFGRLIEQLQEGRTADELDFRHITHGLRAA